MTDDRCPVILLTGFLGSGKTTLLNRLLRDPALSDSLVIVNEFGDIPLDHLLITHVDENIRLLDTGCVCCTVRGDLIDTLVDLRDRRVRGEIRYSRVFIETSGLVDPAPIFHSFAVDPTLTADWELCAVVTTVDAVNGVATLARHEQAQRQVGLADLVIITKGDIATTEQSGAIETRVDQLNHYAKRILVEQDGLAALLTSPDLRQSFAVPSVAEHGHHHGHGHDHSHPSTICSRSLFLDAPVPQAVVLEWIDLLAALRGENLLRLKALIQTVETPDRPMLVQVVQHVVHPVQQLDAWPDEERRSRIVIIGDDLDLDMIENSFRRHLERAGAVSSVESR
ncbi:MAG TPA: GTP-binding protein [Sphingobium sp.]|nr:GTP-binding protein [Sphingobium sp.]